MVSPRRRVQWTDDDREILRLAVPALGALIAEPLYILADTAVVGRMGTPELGGLALASAVLLTTHAVFNFLAYGTTSAVARLIGAGELRRAAQHPLSSGISERPHRHSAVG
jgi:Na+-driven multidrug efflux pump